MDGCERASHDREYWDSEMVRRYLTGWLVEQRKKERVSSLGSHRSEHRLSEHRPSEHPPEAA